MWREDHSTAETAVRSSHSGLTILSYIQYKHRGRKVGFMSGLYPCCFVVLLTGKAKGNVVLLGVSDKTF